MSEQFRLTPAAICRSEFNAHFKRHVDNCTQQELKEVWELLIMHRFEYLDKTKPYCTYSTRYSTSEKLRYVDDVRRVRLNHKLR